MQSPIPGLVLPLRIHERTPVVLLIQFVNLAAKGKLKTMVEMPSVEVLTAFAKASNGQKATGHSYQELLDAMRADPDEAVVRFRALLKDARASVRAWACIAGAKACGRKFVPTLLEAFSDRSQGVQEMVVSGMLEIEPDGRLLRPLVLQMRKRLLTWDGDAAFSIARLLAALNDSDAAPYVARYVKRKDIDAADRMRGEAYLIYLSEGLDGVLNRIRSHVDHARMPVLCKVAFMVGSSDVEPALEQLLVTAPDERCRAIAEQVLNALKAARAQWPAPYWNHEFDYKNLPRSS